jgi:hypothetical protein
VSDLEQQVARSNRVAPTTTADRKEFMYSQIRKTDDAGNEIELTVDAGNWAAIGTWKNSKGQTGPIEVSAQGTEYDLAIYLETHPVADSTELKVLIAKAAQDILKTPQAED